MAAAAIVVALRTSAALAQSGADLAARRDLLIEAERARASSDHARALDLASRAGEIQMTPSVRTFIAQEQNALGQFAEALGNAEQCERDAARDPTTASRASLVEICHRLSTALASRVGRVTIQVADPSVVELRVRVAGHDLAHAFWGVPYIVTPGHVAIEATAAGLDSFHADVEVAAGADVTVPIALAPAPEPAPAPVTTPVARPTEPAGTVAATETPILHLQMQNPIGSQLRPPLAGPIAALSLGALSFGSAVVFFLLRNDAIAQLETMCAPPDRLICADNTTTRGLRDSLNNFNALTNSGLIVGSVVVTAAVAWFIAGRARRAEPSTRARVDIAPIPGGGYVVFSGNL